MPVTSQIESIGDGQEGGGGGWEAEGGPKQPFELKQQCCAFSMGPELAQSTGARNASSWFYSISKKLSVKADLAIYLQVLDVSG